MHDVRDVRLGSLRREIGLVFEETFLFSDTVWENLAFAARRERERPSSTTTEVVRAARARRRRRLHPRAARRVRHACSASTASRSRVVSVSGWRSRARSSPIPRVLILDDATSAVDPSKEHEIRAALTEVMQGRTTLIIAHRPATIALADRVVLMDERRPRSWRRARTRICSRPARTTASVLADISESSTPSRRRRRGGAVTSTSSRSTTATTTTCAEAPEVGRRTLPRAAAVEVEAGRACRCSSSARPR